MPDLLPVLETERLRLRCFTSADAEALAATLTPAVTRWLASWPDPVTAELALERILNDRAAILAGRHVAYAVTLKADQRLIGGLGGGAAHDPQRLALGWHLAEDRHGLGYMGEAARAVLPAIWGMLPVAVIEAGAQLENEASFRLMRSLGMSPIGERLVEAPARGRRERCAFYEVARPAAWRPASIV